MVKCIIQYYTFLHDYDILYPISIYVSDDDDDDDDDRHAVLVHHHHPRHILTHLNPLQHLVKRVLFLSSHFESDGQRQAN